MIIDIKNIIENKKLDKLKEEREERYITRFNRAVVRSLFGFNDKYSFTFGSLPHWREKVYIKLSINGSGTLSYFRGFSYGRDLTEDIFIGTECMRDVITTLRGVGIETHEVPKVFKRDLRSHKENLKLLEEYMNEARRLVEYGIVSAMPKVPLDIMNICNDLVNIILQLTRALVDVYSYGNFLCAIPSERQLLESELDTVLNYLEKLISLLEYCKSYK